MQVGGGGGWGGLPGKVISRVFFSFALECELSECKCSSSSVLNAS